MRGAAAARGPALAGARTAVLVVDVVNTFRFPGGVALLRNARRISTPIVSLQKRARRAGALVVYVNDNYGDWHGSFSGLLRRCLAARAPGRRFVERVAPHAGDVYVLKPRHSGFHSTSLDALLRRHGVENVVLCGLATNMCVLFTAVDAHMRELRVLVPRDCVAAERRSESTAALALMRRSMNAWTGPGSRISFRKGVRRRGSRVNGIGVASRTRRTVRRTS